jgi:hypothetical protein
MWLALAAVIVSALVPGSARYDSQMHAAKILQIVEVGFTLQDPHSPLHVMHSPFHINTFHFLQAVGAWSTDQAPLAFWDASARFLRVLAFGGVEALALRVLRSTWLAAAAMVCAAVSFGPAFGSALPAAISGFIVLPFALIRITEGVVQPTWRRVLTLSICGLALSAIHVGHWVVYSLCLIPVVAAWGMARYRDGLGGGGAVSMLIAWTAGLPLSVITAIQPNYAMAYMGAELHWELSTFVVGSHTVRTLGLSRSIWMVGVLFAAAAFWFLRREHRTRFVVLGGAFMVALQLMLNPMVFAIASEHVPFWILSRLKVFALLIIYVIVPALLASVMRRALAGHARRVMLALALLVASLAVQPDVVATRRWRSTDDRLALKMGAEVRHLLANAGTRPLLCADKELSLLIPAVRRSAVMAPSFGNANPADPGVQQRAAACVELLSDFASDQRRAEIVRTYGIDYVIVRKPQLPRHLMGGRFAAETSSLWLVVPERGDGRG